MAMSDRGDNLRFVSEVMKSMADINDAMHDTVNALSNENIILAKIKLKEIIDVAQKAIETLTPNKEE